MTLFISTVTSGEIEIGIEKQRDINRQFADELTAWMDRLLVSYSDRLLSLDLPAARRWGRLAAQIGNRGMDLTIAAIALDHGLTVATRNVSDFAPAGVVTINPFSASVP